MGVSQDQAILQIASVLSGSSSSKVYSLDLSLKSPNVEYLSSNEPLSFIDESSATILKLDSNQVLKNLPNLITTNSKFIISSNLINDDHSIITACKDLGFTILISSNLKESYDFTLLSYLISKFTNKSILHFYQESNEKIDLYQDDKILSLFESFNDTTLESAFKSLNSLSSKLYSEFELLNSSWFHKPEQYFVLLGNQSKLISKIPSNVGLISIKVYRPFNSSKLLDLIPSGSIVQLIEQSSINLQFQSLFLDLIDSLPNFSKVIASQLLNIDDKNIDGVIHALISNSELEKPIQNLILGSTFKTATNSSSTASKLSDDVYVKILNQVLPNSAILNNAEFLINPTPEYAYGKYLFDEEQRNKLINLVESNLSSFKDSLNDKLTSWLINAKASKPFDANDLITELESSTTNVEIIKSILSLKSYLPIKTQWLVGSDKWCYDQGLSTLHLALQNRHNVKLLIIDSDSSINVKQGKKNIGLYCMNYGNSYVSSVALYSSYTQTLSAILEADSFNYGVAVVLAYLPHYENHLDILKETKKQVDTGYWPLYRYNPFLENSEDQFKLDSSFIRNELQAFLDRENKLTLLAQRSAKLDYNLRSFNNKVSSKINQESKDSFKSLLDNLSGEPLTIAFASDGGNAENLAKKLGRRATNKGLKVKIFSMDDLSLDDLQLEQNIVFICSTSGQGEFPTNGKQFWDALKSSTIDLGTVKISTFGLGDSKYWPRAEDKHYYNKPAQDLFNKLKNLGAVLLCELGLGDDQDADGYNTGYNEWEPKLWESLGVSLDNGDEPAPITNEDMKIASNFLRGTIAEGLLDTSTGAISASDQQMTKFHGIYMQDDRDLRDERKKQGLEPAYSFMARVRLPGGCSTPEQWLKMDELADSRGNHTFKITTRATFQLHGIVKADLKEAIKGINVALMDTLAACGDVCRNVMCSALPMNQHLHNQLVESSKIISEHLLPSTTAYHELWLTDLTDLEREGGPKKIKVGGDALVDAEPLYGPTYLPRKYKIVITMPPYNDVDVWAHDVGLIAIVEDNNVIGYNVLVGGGMGTTHNNTKTYPRTGSMFGFCPIDQIHLVCEKIMLVQRDFGDRKNRKHARLKYTIDDLGVDVYKSKVEELWGHQFSEPKPFKIDSNIDYFGWTKDELDLNHFTCFIENGRIEDTAEKPQKLGLNKIAHYLKDNKVGEFRLTGNQHILVSNIPNDHLDAIKSLLKQYNLDNTDFSALRLSSSSCVAFPTCGLAMAEAERYLPVLIDKLELELEKIGLRNDSVVMRMTGCPNGCARPWMAEIALVGKSYGYYNLMLGGGYKGDRINKLYKTNVSEDEIMKILVPLFQRWAVERFEGEHFGDFVIRAGIIKPTLEGKKFWDDLNDDI
ncbi:hypothetical protein CANARDRAFT_9155 [[Candida] arabinofermentans NRRL YB-2248]|uniref:assimilatory sulfite reductase (NADPH) n=1 Tax=[Candida] arabinofermentans NRRL YB-2248 TaxID=983967 RepID=A0A1E4SWI3_9ASCO|nr:hypothetical protein CANARDRAFT_9155 [[Candida] arabinofermentans NRRL YB-2248]